MLGPTRDQKSQIRVRVRSGLFLPVAAGSSKTLQLYNYGSGSSRSRVKLLSCDTGQSWGQHTQPCFSKTSSLLYSRNARGSNLSSPHGVSAQAVII